MFRLILAGIFAVKVCQAFCQGAGINGYTLEYDSSFEFEQNTNQILLHFDYSGHSLKETPIISFTNQKSVR